ncbi:hypothetical protein BCR44DRAFT_1427860 [Catenaria anguillulae PL171]|uniref:Uncharacterized protein n=1 Tax=Catenaria anguillulae PL171 TaxID=765915 RepID=A0A1Y2HW25_9FUNG|nr:hypothetical protein BCR44DRAFT_1427860 [Catenaria anguillulae PL171]
MAMMASTSFCCCSAMAAASGSRSAAAATAGVGFDPFGGGGGMSLGQRYGSIESKDPAGAAIGCVNGPSRGLCGLQCTGTLAGLASGGHLAMAGRVGQSDGGERWDSLRSGAGQAWRVQIT